MIGKLGEKKNGKKLTSIVLELKRSKFLSIIQDLFLRKLHISSPVDGVATGDWVAWVVAGDWVAGVASRVVVGGANGGGLCTVHSQSALHSFGCSLRHALHLPSRLFDNQTKTLVNLYYSHQVIKS